MLAGDSHAVLSRLVANQAMFTLAFVASVIGFSAWVVLAVLLYRLMSSAGRLSGALMLLFAVAGTAMSFIALSPLIPLIRSTSGGIEAGTLAPMVASYNRLLLLAQVFSGLWLLPFGWLLIRSGIAPRFLGFCLIIGGVSYLMNFATAFAPDLNHLIAYRIVGIATGVLGVFVGELGICLWLLLKGAHDPKVDRAT